MLKIRLARIGRKNAPAFRLIVTPNTHKPATHKALENLGSLDVKKGEFKLKEERVKYWLSRGAQVSSTVKNFLIDKGIVAATKEKTQRRKTKKEKAKK